SITLGNFVPPLLLGGRPDLSCTAITASEWDVFVVASHHKLRTTVTVVGCKFGGFDKSLRYGLLFHQLAMSRSRCSDFTIVSGLLFGIQFRSPVLIAFH